MTASRAPGAGSAIIVGAGLIGCAAAYFLAGAGVEVTIIEAAEPGFGASGRNPGFVSLISRAPGPALEMARAGRALYDRLAVELEDFAFRACGTLTYFFDEQLPLVERFVAARRADGLDCRILAADEARAACAVLPADLAGAVFSPSDASIDSPKLVAALLDGARRAGARLVVDEVTALDVAHGRCVGVSTSRERHAADATIVAAGVRGPTLLAAHGLPLATLRMRSQLALTTRCEQRFDALLYGPTFFREYAFVRALDGYDDRLVRHPLQRTLPEIGLVELVAQRADGRLLLGCPMDFHHGEHATLAGMALTFGVIGDHLPALRGLEIERVWAGTVPQTGDGLPVLGPVGDVDGLFLAAGNAFGVTTGPLNGWLLAQMILDRPTALDLGPFRYARPAVLHGEDRTSVL